MRQLLLISVALAIGCSTTSVCGDDSQCVVAGFAGKCVSSPSSGTGFCAHAFASCASGLMWDGTAGDNLAGTCVGATGPMTDGSTVDRGVTVCQKGVDCVPPNDGLQHRMDCCNSVCVDLLSDSRYCGGCSAMGCAAQQSCCAGSCINTGMDPANCGMCGRACGGKQATWQCTMSMCAVVACTPPFADCNKIATDGCEAKLTSDVNNCTACGSVCTGANAVMTCNNGCAIQMCKAGFADCDKQPANGCEVNIANDPGNCNGCGNKCMLANATASCVNSICAVGQCNPGFLDCNGVAGDGCEVNGNTDSANCGKCGMACPLGQTCGNGMCANSVKYTGAFTMNAIDPQRCTDWNAFRGQLTGNYKSVTIKGSLDNVGVTCVTTVSNEANQIASALSLTGSATVTCSGRTWTVGTCGGGLELSATGLCQCSAPGYTVRPCIGNVQWGGANSTTCTPPSQTLTVVFQ